DGRQRLEQPRPAALVRKRRGVGRELLFADDHLVQTGAAAAREHIRQHVERIAVRRACRRSNPHDVDARQPRERILDRAATLGGVRRLIEIRPLRRRLTRDGAEVLLDETSRLVRFPVADNRQYSVRSELVCPFIVPPLLKTSAGCSPGPTFSEPLNIMCSNRWAKPVRPVRSSAEPTL